MPVLLSAFTPCIGAARLEAELSLILAITIAHAGDTFNGLPSQLTFSTTMSL